MGSSKIVTIANYIELLQSRGLMMQDIADRLGVSPAAVTKYKSGIIQFPSFNIALEQYIVHRIVLHPYGEENLKYEKDK